MTGGVVVSGLAVRGLAWRCRAEIPFPAVLRWLGYDCPEVPVNSVKIHCPFEFLHADGGIEPAMRVYAAENNAWCFAGCGYFDVVGLARAVWDCDVSAAADRLATWWWGTVSADPLADPAVLLTPAVPRVTGADLVEALRVYCGRLPGWPELELHPAVLAGFQAASSVLARVGPADDVTEWLTRCKRYMDGVVAQVALVEG